LSTKWSKAANNDGCAVARSDEAKALGTSIELTGYVRMALGEGIEKKEEDFAAEVAAVAGGA
jgi:elongation factor Ts